MSRSQIENFRYLVEIGSEDVDPLDSHLMPAVAEGFETSILSWSRDEIPAEVGIFINRHHCIYV